MGRLSKLIGVVILCALPATAMAETVTPVSYVADHIRSYQESVCADLVHEHGRNRCLVAVQRRTIWRQADHLADLIVEAADNAGVPWSVILVLVQFESGFRVGVEGRIGERGLLQVHGQAARGHDLSTAAGELAAGAMWYAAMLEKCGDRYQALQAYQTGRCRGKAAGPARRLARITQIDDEFSALSSQASSR